MVCRLKLPRVSEATSVDGTSVFSYLSPCLHYFCISQSAEDGRIAEYLFLSSGYTPFSSAGLGVGCIARKICPLGGQWVGAVGVCFAEKTSGKVSSLFPKICMALSSFSSIIRTQSLMSN